MCEESEGRIVVENNIAFVVDDFDGKKTQVGSSYIKYHGRKVSIEYGMLVGDIKVSLI